MAKKTKEAKYSGANSPRLGVREAKRVANIRGKHEGEKMEDLYMELFKTMNQFRKLHIADIIPGLSHAEFFTLNCVMDAEDSRLTISELAAKAKVLPSAVSRTLRGLEERGYAQRSVDKTDRRNTYVTLTETGRAVTLECRQIMHDFGMAVMSRLDANDMKQLIGYLSEIYNISRAEIEARKLCNSGKEKTDE